MKRGEFFSCPACGGDLAEDVQECYFFKEGDKIEQLEGELDAATAELHAMRTERDHGRAAKERYCTVPGVPAPRVHFGRISTSSQ